MPTSYLPSLGLKPEVDLVLAHVAKEDQQYADWFSNNPPNQFLRGVGLNTKRIMDNGAFELGESMDPNRLIELGTKVKATHLVLPDYPGEPAQKTIDAAHKWAPKFIEAGFKTIFVPQGKIGSYSDYEKALTYAAAAYSDGLVQQLALSIIGVPNIYSVYKDKTQRFLARWHLLSTLPLLNPNLYKLISVIPIHMLGLLDGINEIRLIKQALRNNSYNIQSWDSSAAVWYAINDLEFDQSPTGRLAGKFEVEVDFNAAFDQSKIDAASRNMNTIERLCILA